MLGMRLISNLFQVILVCAGAGVLTALLAAIASVILSIHGIENHLSPQHLALICLVGAVVSLPLVLLKRCRFRSRA